MTEEEVASSLSQYGAIKEIFLKKEDDGRLRGFGFITFQSVDAAKQLLSHGSHHNVGGRMITVRAADAGKGKGKGGDKVPPPSTNVLRATDMPANPKERDCFKLFYNYSVTRLRDCGTDTFVEFTSQTECERAFNDKQGIKMGTFFVKLVGSSKEEMAEAVAALEASAPAQQGGTSSGAQASAAAPAAMQGGVPLQAGPVATGQAFQDMSVLTGAAGSGQIPALPTWEQLASIGTTQEIPDLSGMQAFGGFGGAAAPVAHTPQVIPPPVVLPSFDATGGVNLGSLGGVGLQLRTALAAAAQTQLACRRSCSGPSFERNER